MSPEGQQCESEPLGQGIEPSQRSVLGQDDHKSISEEPGNELPSNIIGEYVTTAARDRIAFLEVVAVNPQGLGRMDNGEPISPTQMLLERTFMMECYQGIHSAIDGRVEEKFAVAKRLMVIMWRRSGLL